MPFYAPEFASAVLEKFRIYERYLRASGYADLIELCARAYYGQDERGSSHGVSLAGERGELLRAHVNHLRNLVRHHQNLALQERLSLEPEATSEDWEANVQVRRASAWLEDQMWSKGFNADIDRWSEMTDVCGWAFLMQLWDVHAGEPYLPTDFGNPAAGAEMTGDAVRHVLSPFDCAIDPFQGSYKGRWHVARVTGNKHEYAARFPEHAEAILGLTRERYSERLSLDVGLGLDLLQGNALADDDNIDVYHLMHERAPHCRDGRYAVVLSGDLVLMDGPLPFRRGTVRRMAQAEVFNTPFGYTEAFDLLAPQQAFNVLSSITMTNARAGGVGLIMAPQGSSISPEQIAQGLALVHYPVGAQPPSVEHMAETRPEIFEGMDRTVAAMESSIGVNSTTRGNAPGANMSGSSLALLEGTSVRAATPFQKVIVEAASQAALDSIMLAQDFLQAPVTLAVYGEWNALLEETFTGEQISRIVRVRVKPGNPMGRTLAGRVQMADTLLERGLITDTRVYFKLLETGRWEGISRGPEASLGNIQRENQLMLRGQAPVGLVADDHRQHYMEHKVLLDSPAAREPGNPLAQLVTEHLAWHESQLVMLTMRRPWLLEMTGQAPLQSVMGMMQPQMPPGGPDAPGGALPPGPSAQPALPAGAEGEAPPDGLGAAKQPSMPTNPATGQEYDAVTGGGMAQPPTQPQ